MIPILLNHDVERVIGKIDGDVIRFRDMKYDTINVASLTPGFIVEEHDEAGMIKRARIIEFSVIDK